MSYFYNVMKKLYFAKLTKIRRRITYYLQIPAKIILILIITLITLNILLFN